MPLPRKIRPLSLTLALWTALTIPCSAQMLTLTHFPDPSDFPTLSLLGYDGAVLTLDPSRSATWQPAFDAAAAAGIKLIVGGFPPPYVYNAGTWSITASGMALLNFLQSHADQILALYVFNEPYYTNPYTSQPSSCGYFSADDLRGLRTLLQTVWPGVKVYHDLGDPADYAPTGAYAMRTPCVGNKYADQTGVADYVGIWQYPFTAGNANTAGALSALAASASFVSNAMRPAQPISLTQTFACPGCDPSLVFPTRQQLLSWNCGTRALPLAGIDFYPWQAFIPAYTEALANHAPDWPVTTPAACQPGMGADLIGQSAADGAPFVAPDSIVSVYGANLTNAAPYTATPPLPTSFAGMSLQIHDAAGTAHLAQLAFVSANQINFVLPADVPAGQAALAWLNGKRPVGLGTVLVQSIAPALFTADGTGQGVAAAAAVVVGTDNQQSIVPVFQCTGAACTSVPIDLSSGNPVYLTLYGTGIRNYTTAIACAINGVSVPISAAGPQGVYDGLDQINLGPLPDLSGSGEVNLVLTVDGIAANTVRVSFL
jgi:uncharacterized protein (TIGR03437 family)